MEEFREELGKAMVRIYETVRERVDVRCKHCGSWHIVKYGKFRGIQYWWCKDCKRKFVDNEALPKMKTPIIQIASALSMFYEGMSLHGIRRNLDQFRHHFKSDKEEAWGGKASTPEDAFSEL